MPDLIRAAHLIGGSAALMVALAGCRDAPTSPRPRPEAPAPGFISLVSVTHPQYSGSSYSFGAKVACVAPGGSCSCEVTAYLESGSLSVPGSCMIMGTTMQGSGYLRRAGSYTVVITARSAVDFAGEWFGTSVLRRPVPIAIRPRSIASGSTDSGLVLVVVSGGPPERVSIPTITLGDGRHAQIGVAVRNGTPVAELRDADGDGDQDLVVGFWWSELVASGAVANPAAELVLKATTLIDGIEVEGRAPQPPLMAPLIVSAGGPYAAAEGQAITFIGNADGGTAPLQLQWSFGDGAQGATALAAHAYADDGVYTVTLRATDALGATTAAATTATVTNAPPTLELSGGGAIYSGQTLTVRGRVADAGTNDAPWRWTVEWPAGVASTSGLLASVPGEVTAATILRRAGSGSVTMRVVDKDGGVASASLPVVVRRLPVPMRMAPASSHALQRGNGLLTVTLFTTDAVAVVDIVTASVRLDGVRVDTRGNGDLHAALEDENGDGIPELVLKFRRDPLRAALGPGTVLTLHADLRDGRQVEARWTVAANAPPR